MCKIWGVGREKNPKPYSASEYGVAQFGGSKALGPEVVKSLRCSKLRVQGLRVRV